MRQEWMGTQQGFGKLRNQGKYFYLDLAARRVNKSNSMRDVVGFSYARKAMIRFGLALNTSGVSELCQLSTELQKILEIYPQ